MGFTFLHCFPLLLAAGNVCYTTTNPNSFNDLQSFNTWRQEHNKGYYNIRNLSEHFDNWFDNRDFVNNYNYRHRNSHVDHHHLSLNQFADIHHEEWSERDGVNFVLNEQCLSLPTTSPLDHSLPNSVDWRKHNLVTEVKNQGQCGSCWAFSAVGSMEGAHAKATGHLVSLSESQIVDCDVNGSDFGCDGGWMDGAFQYVINNHGIDSEKKYPYVAVDAPCQFNKSHVVAHFSNFSDVVGGENALKKAVAQVGPVSVAIDASNPSFQFYSGGVYFEPDCSQTMLDHGVLVVGYNTTANGTDYWIVKNSWGPNWGIHGYIYMSRNRDNNCGIATKPSYPIV